MGPQNAAKSSRQLYGGGSYSPSDRANAAVRTATQGQNKSNQVVGENGNGSSKTPSQESKPNNPAGGNPPSQKQQTAARYSQPGGSSIADEKA